MSLKAGDKVRFLDEKGEGVITRFIDNRQVLVQMDDGFEIPYLIAKLVPAEAPAKPSPSSASRKEVEPETVYSPVASSEQAIYTDGVFLVYVPLDSGFLLSGNFRVMVFNMSSNHIQFSISSRNLGKYTCEFAGSLAPMQSCSVREIKTSDIERWATLRIEVLFYSYEPYVPREPVSRLIKQKVAKFFKESSFSSGGLTSEPSITLDLTRAMQRGQEEEYFEEKDLSRIVLEKESRVSKSLSVRSEKNNSLLEWEIDLHAEELTENLAGMSNGQIIDMQLRFFQGKLDEAIAGNIRKVVFIHGVGNGRLKGEIRKILATLKGIRYHDASYSSYGFGATEVEIF